MKHLKSTRTGLIAALCVMVGAAGGIAGSTAAKHKSTHRASSRAAGTAPRFPGPPPGAHRMAVHEDEVVLNKAGTAFITATEDNGIVQSVSGDQLTLKEGTKTVTYKTVTVTVPSGAKVYRNGATAQLSDLKAGDHAHVSQSSDGAVVFAGDAAHGPGPGGHRFGPGRFRDHGFGPGGPPPGGPPPMNG
ncbi:MAG: hypothetical protein QOK31_1098 [Solirubrobacteraceae bacterium]|nr:hypothetical protein [Solirubrobacteraceae bacterium]